MNRNEYLFLAMALAIIGLGYMIQQYWKYGTAALPNRPLIIGTIFAFVTAYLMARGLTVD